MEYLKAVLRRDSTNNIVLKWLDVTERLDKSIGILSVFGFISDLSNEMRDVRNELVLRSYES